MFKCIISFRARMCSCPVRNKQQHQEHTEQLNKYYYLYLLISDFFLLLGVLVMINNSQDELFSEVLLSCLICSTGVAVLYFSNLSIISNVA